MKNLFLFLLIFINASAAFSQKKFINRKIAQKNYEGYLFMKESKYDSALKIFDAAIKADPEAFFIFQNRALCKMYLQDTTGAIADFNTNLQLDPSNFESMYSLGNIYKYKKDSVRASKYFTKSIAMADTTLSPKKLLYMSNFLGNYFSVNQKYDSALNYYTIVQSLDSAQSSVYINSAVCNFHLKRMEAFCMDLQQAYINGGSISCAVLQYYCEGCSSRLINERGKFDTLSLANDIRLIGIIPDNLLQTKSTYKSFSFTEDAEVPKVLQKKKVYYNAHWQICNAEDALYYREAVWNSLRNFYTRDFTDYYINGKIYAEGNITNDGLNGTYTCFYENGNTKIKGEFIHDIPVKTWLFYHENGSKKMNLQFDFDSFKVHFYSETNPNFEVNSGNGTFRIVLDSWGDIDFVVKGEYKNFQKSGKWLYLQNKKKIVSEVHKNGRFVRGYFIADDGQQIKLLNSTFDARFWIPPQLKQINSLYFDKLETINSYPFIRTSIF